MTKEYRSAGAVVATGPLRQPRILLLDQTRYTGERQTVAPKGQIEEGETPQGAAVREVAEEAGVHGLAYVGDLGQQSFRFTNGDGAPSRKTVDWFLFTTAICATTPNLADGFTAARWVEPATARRVISHPTFTLILDRALATLAQEADGEPKRGLP